MWDSDRVFMAQSVFCSSKDKYDFSYRTHDRVGASTKRTRLLMRRKAQEAQGDVKATLEARVKRIRDAALKARTVQ